MTELPVERLLLEALTVIEGEKIPYAIMGGFAVRTWGVPRPTYDADVAVAVDDPGLVLLLKALEDAGFQVPEEYRTGFRDTLAGMSKIKVTRFEEGTVWDVDLFLARGGLLESALDRRRRVTLAERPVWVMSAEDVILLKLVAHRRKDQLDIEEIVRIARDLDHDYLRSWASRLGVTERWDAFQKELEDDE